MLFSPVFMAGEATLYVQASRLKNVATVHWRFSNSPTTRHFVWWLLNQSYESRMRHLKKHPELAIVIFFIIAACIALPYYATHKPGKEPPPASSNNTSPAPVSTAPAPATKPTDGTDMLIQEQAWIRKMQNNVRQRLKDPDSAKFKDSKVYRAIGAPVVCGRVNAKNSFGGYGGWERFIAAGEMVFLQSDMEKAEFTKSWIRICH